MTKIDVNTIDGNKIGTVSLRKIKPASSVLISHNVLTNLANKRQSIANTKTRAEVSGGGKKPWRQKGTGQARAGSNRSPLWIGGGVTFGPRSRRNFFKRINRKQRLIAINGLLSKKADEGNFKIIEKIDLPTGKTKDMILLLSLVGIDGQVILVLDKDFSASMEAEKIYDAGRNISFLTITSLDKLNTFAILKNKWVLFTKKAFEELEKRLEVLKDEKVEKKEEEETKKEIQKAKSKEIKKTVKKVRAKKESE